MGPTGSDSVRLGLGIANSVRLGPTRSDGSDSAWLKLAGSDWVRLTGQLIPPGANLVQQSPIGSDWTLTKNAQGPTGSDWTWILEAEYCMRIRASWARSESESDCNFQIWVRVRNTVPISEIIWLVYVGFAG